MEKPIVVERFADNGEHSHWELISTGGEVLWDNWEAHWDYKQELEMYEKKLKERQEELDRLIAKYKWKLDETK